MIEAPVRVPAGDAGHAAHPRFDRAAWCVLAYNMLVVLWGAFVRATGSGAGCGDHWPLCNGTVVPRAPSIETVIEFTHRITSGLAIVGVVGLCIWAFRLFPRGHRARLFAALSVVFLFAEALLGAGLVLLRYVERDASAGRALYLSAHLINTQILLMMLTMTAWFGVEGISRRWKSAPRLALIALPVSVVVSVSGAIAALGDTLFPATSLVSGFQQEFSSSSSTLLRLRVLHPALAVAAAFFLIAAAVSVRRLGRPAGSRAASISIVLVALQLAAGVLNVILLAPVWMQIVHLLIADLLWIALLLMTLEAGRAQ